MVSQKNSLKRFGLKSKAFLSFKTGFSTEEVSTPEKQAVIKLPEKKIEIKYFYKLKVNISSQYLTLN